MTFFGDQPDWQNGVISPQLQVGNFGAVTSGVVNIPPAAQSLLIFNKGAAQAYQCVSVVGVTTGYSYPFNSNDFDTAPPYESMYVAVAAPGIDSSVTITWNGAPPNGWVVVADSGVRGVVDQTLFALAVENGGPALGGGFEVYGWDGTDDRQPLTDTSGRLITIGIGGNTHTAGSVGNGGTMLGAPAAGSAHIVTGLVLGVVNVPENAECVGASSGAIYGTTQITTGSYNTAVYMASPWEVTEALVLNDVSINQVLFFSVHYRTVPTV